MTPARQVCRSVMLVAWSLKRAEPGRTFADCLRAAWAWTKRMASSTAAFLANTRRNGGHVHIGGDLVQSATRRVLSGARYAESRAQAGARVAARLAW